MGMYVVFAGSVPVYFNSLPAATAFAESYRTSVRVNLRKALY